MERLIRPMHARDIDGCLELWRQVEGIVLREESDDAPGLKRFLLRNPGKSFVAEDDSQIIGNILCGHDGRRAHLYHLAVRQDQRRTRCATVLLNSTLTALTAEGISHCHAYVRARNLTALKFWTTVGAQLRRDIHVVTLQLDAPAAESDREIVCIDASQAVAPE